MNYNLKIELLSDACICSGASYGASVDTDVYTNEYGFPYIPSKRLKGLFREAFKEYNEMINDCLNIDELLGTEDALEGKLKIGNAELDEYIKEKNKIINDIKRNNIHPGFVKDLYVSSRTQTSIDPVTEEAKDKSLRTTNVVNKGLCFISSISGIDENEFELIKKAIKLIKHMGLHRNRGLGLVKLSIEKDDKVNNVILGKTFDYIELHISNEQALMISSNLKDKTLPYISGSSIYGYFANKYAELNNIGKDDEDEMFNKLFLENNILFTNAYISDEEFNEYVPVPSFIAKEKNKGANGETVYVNTLKGSSKNKIASLSGKFIKKDELLNEEGLPLKSLHVIEPIFEHNYHTALEDGIVKEDGGFYSYFSLAPNQHFVSKIYGDSELIKKLFETVNSNTIYLGKCKNSQYGKCNIEVVSKTNKSLNKGDLLVFTSPCIINDDKNNNVLDINGIADSLNITDIKGYSLNYASFGGYNVLWNLAKKQLTSIQMESYIEGKFDINSNFVGENNNIGFGEVLFLNKDKLCKDNNKESNNNHKYDLGNSNWYKEGKYYKNIHSSEIMDEAYNYFFDNKSLSRKFNSTQVEKLLRMLKEQETYDSLHQNIDDIEKESFRDDAIKLVESIRENTIDYKDFKLYFKTILTLMKYNLREKEGE